MFVSDAEIFDFTVQGRGLPAQADPPLSPSTFDEKSHQGRDQNGWVIGSTGLSQLVHQGTNPGTLGNLNTLSYHRQHTHGGINIWQYCEFVLHENGSGGDSDVSSQHKHVPQLT